MDATGSRASQIIEAKEQEIHQEARQRLFLHVSSVLLSALLFHSPLSANQPTLLLCPPDPNTTHRHSLSLSLTFHSHLPSLPFKGPSQTNWLSLCLQNPENLIGQTLGKCPSLVHKKEEAGLPGAYQFGWVLQERESLWAGQVASEMSITTWDQSTRCPMLSNSISISIIPTVPVLITANPSHASGTLLALCACYFISSSQQPCFTDVETKELHTQGHTGKGRAGIQTRAIWLQSLSS